MINIKYKYKHNKIKVYEVHDACQPWSFKHNLKLLYHLIEKGDVLRYKIMGMNICILKGLFR